MVILESKAYGLPLATYEPPYLSITKDTKGILSVTKGDIDNMAENIINIISDKALREKLGREARESFEGFASYDLGNAWKNIFNLCSDDKKSFSDPAFYDPQGLDPSTADMLPMLFDRIFEEYDKCPEYRVGVKLLKLPRKIKKKLDIYKAR